jgi:protein-disulfide isomerase
VVYRRALIVAAALCLWPVARLLAAQAAAPGSTPPSPAETVKASPAPNRTEEAILHKLIELQLQITTLKGEVAQLRRALGELGVGPAAADASAKGNGKGVQITLNATYPVLGNPEAPIAIVEFSDFQCPYCGRFQQDTFSELKKVYIDTGRVRYISRQFPLPMHPLARDAAIAARCAAKQQAYWKMRDSLFSQQPRLGPELYKELSATLQLDRSAFTGCLTDPSSAADVDADLALGQSLGVRGTPSFFVGRVAKGQIVDAQNIRGAKPFPMFVRAIEPLLQ